MKALIFFISILFLSLSLSARECQDPEYKQALKILKDLKEDLSKHELLPAAQPDRIERDYMSKYGSKPSDDVVALVRTELILKPRVQMRSYTQQLDCGELNSKPSEIATKIKDDLTNIMKQLSNVIATGADMETRGSAIQDIHELYYGAAANFLSFKSTTLSHVIPEFEQQFTSLCDSKPIPYAGSSLVGCQPVTNSFKEEGTTCIHAFRCATQSFGCNSGSDPIRMYGYTFKTSCTSGYKNICENWRACALQQIGSGGELEKRKINVNQ